MGLELVHGQLGSPEHSVFDVDSAAWDQIIELARRNGWTPSDETVKSSKNITIWAYWNNPAKVSGQDALSMAEALEQALRIPPLAEAHLPEAIRSLENGVEAALADPNLSRFIGLRRELVERFVDFLRKGEFIYAAE